METELIYEIIGYVASVLIAVSLMMSAIVKLRIINMIGAATFTLYGILIGAIPVAAMNGFIVLINIYYLTRIFTAEEYFTLLRVKPDSHYLSYFLEFYKDQIENYQPGFSFDPQKSDLCIFVLRDMVPAGLLIADMDKKDELTVDLDFVIPNYRDFKIGRYLFKDRIAFFKELGIKRVFSRAGSKKHNKYLEKIGFTPADSAGKWYQLALT